MLFWELTYSFRDFLMQILVYRFNGLVVMISVSHNARRGSQKVSSSILD
jgi:hypothetical protein